MTDEHQLWGAETDKAVANFQISGEPVPLGVVHWLARIKSAAARTNVELGLLDDERAIGDLRQLRTPSQEGPTTTSSRSTCSRPGRGPRPT